MDFEKSVERECAEYLLGAIRGHLTQIVYSIVHDAYIAGYQKGLEHAQEPD